MGGMTGAGTRVADPEVMPRVGDTDLRPVGGRRIELWRGGGSKTGCAGIGGGCLRGGRGGTLTGWSLDVDLAVRLTNGLCVACGMGWDLGTSWRERG